MNDKTKTIYNLARMYEYVNDISVLCEKCDYNIENILNDKDL